MDSIVCDSAVREIVASDCDYSTTEFGSLFRREIFNYSDCSKGDAFGIEFTICFRDYRDIVLSGFKTVVLNNECLFSVINAYDS